jgi:hypothetical protein
MPKPFVTRVLVPWIVGGVSSVVPEGLRERIESGALALPIPPLRGHVEYQVLGVLVLLRYGGYTIVIRKLAGALLAVGELQGNIIAVCSLLLLPVTFQYHNYTYDPATLFLSTLLWYLLYQGRRGGYLLVFALACVNKETALVFVLSATLWESARGKVRENLPFLSAMVGLWLAIRVGIALLSAHISGPWMEMHFFDYNMTRVFFRMDPGQLAAALLIGLLLFAYWRRKPLMLKIGMLHLGVPVGMALFWGWMDEYRMYLDCYAIVVLSVAHSLVRIGEVRIGEVRIGEVAVA